MQGVQGSRPLPCIHAHNLALCPPHMLASHALGSALDLSLFRHALSGRRAARGATAHIRQANRKRLTAGPEPLLLLTGLKSGRYGQDNITQVGRFPAVMARHPEFTYLPIIADIGHLFGVTCRPGGACNRGDL